MSNTVDSRILEMQFNNKQFESGIKTSLNSLNLLEKGLQLKGASKGLTELDRASKSMNFEHLANSVDTIASKFSALGIMGVTALQNIANQAYHTAERMVKSLTIEPIMAGFSEYETQINSVQTILANTKKEGTTLEDVTAALDELNAYADKTIYNFTEMTRNIGTFTAAGVKLDTATNAIQGIANLAAVSGANSQQASTAMYQMSQALASGTVRLQDWMSIENASMGGQLFQDALMETARVNGVAIDKMLAKHKSFRYTLQEGWLTAEMMTETLEKFTATTEGLTDEQIAANREMWRARGYTDEQIDAIFELGKTATDAATKVKTFTQLFDTLKETAQSGWTQSWEILIGDFEEAKDLLTQINNELGGIIEASALARNNLLQAWKDAGGRDDLIEGFKNLYEALKSIVKPAREAFEEMFPPITAEKLKNFTQGFEDFTKKLKASPKMTDKLKRTFKGFFAILDIGAQGLSALASGFAKVIGYALPVGSNLLDMTASLGDFLVELSNTVRETGIFNVAMDGIGKAIKFAADMFDKLTAKGAEVFEFFSNIDLSGIEVKFEPIKSIAEAGAWAMEKLQAAFEKVLPFLTTVGSSIGDAFGGAASSITGAIQNGTFSELAEGGMFAVLAVGIAKIAKAFGDIGKNASGVLENLADVFEGVTGALEGMQNKLNAEALKSIATAIAILAGSLAVLSLVDPDNLGASLAAVTTMFMELIGALTATNTLMGKAKTSKLSVTITAMMGMATAILILAAAMALMGNMDPGSILTGVFAIASLIGVLTLATKTLSDGSIQMMKGAGSLIAFSIAVGILALSVKALGNMDLESIGKGLLALGGILFELALFLNSGSLAAVGLSASIGLMAIATALLILAGAIFLMGSMDLSTIGQGLLVLGVSLIMLTMAANALPPTLISAGVGLMAIATALLIVSAALLIMGSMSLDNLATGLIAMGVSLLFMVAAANAMNGALAGAAAMLVMAAAITVLGIALNIVGAMSAGNAIQALLTLVATLAILGVGATLLAPVIPAMLGLGAALLVFAAAAALSGVALMALGAGLTAIGVGISALVVGIVSSITAIVGAIPVLAEQFGAAIVAIADAISAAAPACGEAISAVIQMIIDIIANAITAIAGAIGGAGPAILQLAGYLLVLGAVSAVLAPLAPAIVAVSIALAAFGVACIAIAAGVALLAGALALLGVSGLTVASAMTDISKAIQSFGKSSLSAVKSAAKTFYSAGEEAAEEVLKGLKSGLKNSDDAMGALVKSMTGEAESAKGKFTSAGETLASSFSKSLTTALQNGAKTASSNMTASMNSLVSACTSVLTNSTSKFQSAGSTMISKLASGMNSKRGSATNAVTSIASAVQSAVNGMTSTFYNYGVNVAQGLANGINARAYAAVNAAKSMSNRVKAAARHELDINSPSKEFEDIGMWVDMGLANGLLKFAKLATNASTQLAQSTIQPVMTMTDSMISDLSSMGSALRGTASMASALDGSITSEQHVVVSHQFEDLTVKGVNDRNEFVAVANYSVEEMLTELMRKGIRR